MNVVVDSTVWSLALRRASPRDTPEEGELAELVREGRVVMLGPIRQELLSGVRSAKQWAELRGRLRAFPDAPLSEEDFEEASACFNRCRSKGVQGSNTDFLICAVALRRDLAVFTTDGDFVRYATVLGVKLHGRRSS